MSTKVNKTLLHVPDNAIEELQTFSRSMQMRNLYHEVHASGAIPQELKDELEQVVLGYASLFDVAPPDITGMEFDTVLTISNQEIKVARLMKERGLYRLVMSLEMVDEYGLPMWQQLINETTGKPFEKRDDMISAFCAVSHVSRQSVYTRLSLYRMLALVGYTSEESYKLVLQRPTLIYKTLNRLGDWGWGASGIETLDTDVVESLLKHYGCDDELLILLEDYKQGDVDAGEELFTKMRPQIREMVDEIVTHPNVKEAARYLDIDVLSASMVSYRWDLDNDCLIISVDSPVIESSTGEIIDRRSENIRVLPDNVQGYFPEAVKKDLLARLPILNRKDVEFLKGSEEYVE